MSNLKAKQVNFAVYLHYRDGLDLTNAGVYVLEDGNNVVAARTGPSHELRPYSLDTSFGDQKEIHYVQTQGMWLYYV